MRPTDSQIRDSFEKAGFWCLCITLFLLPFPRSWSLYPLGTILFTGLVIWIIDFKSTLDRFVKVWYLVLPSVFYFIVHLISVINQKAEIILLENRLMFLLVPLLGFPVFISKQVKDGLTRIFSIFILGIAIISLFLLIRIFFLIGSNYPGGIKLFEWLNHNELSYFSLGFSVFEHPTYIALKITWALIILLFFGNLTYFKPGFIILIFILLTGALLFAASKAGLTIWIIVMLIYLFRTLRKGIRNPILYIGLIAFLIFAAVTLSMRINRINSFVTEIKSQMAAEYPDIKNIDQRTREWYSALQVIKENPVIGTGLSKASDRLVEEYIRNGFNDEAALRLNVHNQFLESQLTFGIFGTISLLLLLYVPAFFSRKMIHPGLIISLISLTSFFLLIESMFNRQWGIMFFLLFYNMIALKLKESSTCNVLT
jgi:O-antigen ligase